MSTNRTHHVQRTSEYDCTPTLRWMDGELVVLPVWMDTILNQVLNGKPAPAARPDLFGEGS